MPVASPEYLTVEDVKATQMHIITTIILPFKPVILVVEFSHSVVSLSNPMNHSTPGFPAHHQLPESTQTHVRCDISLYIYGTSPTHLNQNLEVISSISPQLLSHTFTYIQWVINALKHNSLLLPPPLIRVFWVNCIFPLSIFSNNCVLHLIIKIVYFKWISRLLKWTNPSIYPFTHHWKRSFQWFCANIALGTSCFCPYPLKWMVPGSPILLSATERLSPDSLLSEIGHGIEKCELSKWMHIA